MSWGEVTVKPLKLFSKIALPAMGAMTMIAVLTLLSRVLGFGRWLAQSVWVGAGEVGNAYASANQMPNVVFEVAVGGALAGIMVPLLAGFVAKEVKNKVEEISSVMLTWALLVLVPLSLLMFFFASSIVSWLPVTKGSDAVTQNILATNFLRVFAMQIPLYGISVVLSGVLQAHKKFFFPALAPVFSSLTVIVTYALYGYFAQGIDSSTLTPRVAIEILAWGTTLGVASMALPLFIPVYRLGLRLRPRFYLEPQLRTRAFSLGSAGIAALLAQQVAVLVNLFLLRSGGQLGTINVMQYAQAVYVLPYALLVVPIGTAVFPRLGELIAIDDERKYVQLCAKAVRLTLVVSFIGASSLVVFGPGIQSIFGIRMVAEGMDGALVWLAPSLPGYALLFLVSRILYTCDLSRYAVWSAVLGWVGTSICGIYLVAWFAPHGSDGPATLMALGIAQSIGMTLAGIFLLFSLYFKVGPATLHGSWQISLLAITLCSFNAILLRKGYWVFLNIWGESFFNVLAICLVLALVFTLFSFVIVWILQFFSTTVLDAQTTVSKQKGEG